MRNSRAAWLVDGLALTGAGCVVYGAALVSPSVAWTIGGLVLIGISVLWSMGEWGKRR